MIDEIRRQLHLLGMRINPLGSYLKSQRVLPCPYRPNGGPCDRERRTLSTAESGNLLHLAHSIDACTACWVSLLNGQTATRTEAYFCRWGSKERYDIPCEQVHLLEERRCHQLPDDPIYSNKELNEEIPRIEWLSEDGWHRWYTPVAVMYLRRAFEMRSWSGRMQREREAPLDHPTCRPCGASSRKCESASCCPCAARRQG